MCLIFSLVKPFNWNLLYSQVKPVIKNEANPFKKLQMIAEELHLKVFVTPEKGKDGSKFSVWSKTQHSWIQFIIFDLFDKNLCCRIYCLCATGNRAPNNPSWTSRKWVCCHSTSCFKCPPVPWNYGLRYHWSLISFSWFYCDILLLYLFVFDLVSYRSRQILVHGNRKQREWVLH